MGNPPAGWSEWVIRDLAPKRGLAGGPFGSSLGTKDYVRMGVPVIRGQNLSSDGKFDGSEFVYVSEGKADELKRNIAIPGDLVFTQRGTLGQVGVVPANNFERYVISQSQMRLRPDPEVADVDFLYYVFRSPQMLDMIDSRAIVTGVPHINLGILGDFHVLLPPLSVQRVIADVLGALDDKIKSNRQRAELLDAILLYEYLLLLKRDDAKTVPLETLVKPALGGVWGSDNATEKEQLKVSCFRGVDLASIARTEWPKPPTRWIREGQFAPRKFGLGEIWLEGSGSFCGRSLLISESIQQLFDEPVCYSNFVKRVVPMSDPRLSVVSWLALRHAYNIGEVAQSRIGSAFPNLDLGALLVNTQVLVPDDSDLNRLCGLTENRLDTQVLRENRTLSELRDTLLPELLSGRLRVADIESMMETV